MQSFGTICLWALAVCTLWNESLATSLRGGYMFQLDDPSPDSICLPELRSLLNDVVQAQNQGNTNTRESDNEIKSKLETLEVKIGKELAKLPQEVHSELEGRLQGVENKLGGRLQGLEGQLQEVQTKLEAQQTKMGAKLDDSLLAVKTNLEGQLLGVENKLEGHLQEVQTKVEAKLEESLHEVKTKLDGQLQGLQERQTKLDGQQTKMETNLEDIPASATITIPSGFERIGSRYFRIVKEEFADWETAERKCREMGGYLASFRNEEEIKAIKPKIRNSFYWLGINDQGNEGHFISVASQKPALFLKWVEGYSSDINHQVNCVHLHKGKMSDNFCDAKLPFICQADNET
ncbi:hypothetical protein KR059_006796 [Drosophila kikkawai]|nr:hypothetical protein KR059_006796 [Drosophila kikkawai]